MPTLVCVPIMVQDEPTAIRDAVFARDAGADLVEFRIDGFFSGSPTRTPGGGDPPPADGGPFDEREVNAILRIIAASPLPCIVTCRASDEAGPGAGYDGDEPARVALYERLGTARRGPHEAPPNYLDFELASYTRSANLRQKVNLAVGHPRHHRKSETGLILSTHALDGRPADLLRRVRALAEEPAAAVAKIAFTARSLRDNLELFDLLRENAAGKPTIALAMGRFGLPSRVLAGKFGAFLTFAALKPAQSTAPGQPTVAQLLDLYRFRAIGPRTRVLGVIGWPVEHSLSPYIHNAGFEAYSTDSWDAAENAAGEPTDAVYLPLPVPPEYEHFKATLSALIDHPTLDFHGGSVTVPHKQHLVRFAQERAAGGAPLTAHHPITDADGVRWSIDEVSARCGAANTLIITRAAEPGGRSRPSSAHLLNTDARAAVACLRQALGDLRDVRVGLVGAGGVARAVAAGLLEHGAEVVVYNRTRSTAELLLHDLSDDQRLSIGHWETLAEAECRALVNCTPMGMTGGPAPEACAIPREVLLRLQPATVIMDTVYTPLQTPLLKGAADADLCTIDGLGMFVRQAGEQFTAWTDRAAPLQLFERICRDVLGART